MTPVDDIETERLVLRLLPVEALQATDDGSVAEVGRLLGCVMSVDWAEVGRLAAMRLEQLAEDPAYLPWSIRAVVLRATNEAVGYVNFYAQPAAHRALPPAPNRPETGHT